MNALLILFHLGLIIFIGYRLWLRQKDILFWPALFFKLFCGILLGLLYRNYYADGDTWSFYRDAATVAQSIQDHPGKSLSFFWSDDLSGLSGTLEDDKPRSLFMIKWVSVVKLITFGSYWVVSLYFSLISFLAFWFAYRIVSQEFKSKMTAAVSLLFIPSIVFWSSGLIKESLASAAMMVMTAVFMKWYFQSRMKVVESILFLAGLWISWNLKYYWTAVWLGVFIPTMVVKLLSIRVSGVKNNPMVCWLAIFIAAGTIVSFLHPNFYPERFFEVVLMNHNSYLEKSGPDGTIHYYHFDGTFLSMLINAPWALFSGLFRPLVFEANNILQLLAGSENILTAGAAIFAVVKFRGVSFNYKIIVLAVFFYILILAVFLALSTPNLGTLSRYKVGFMPFFVFIIAHGINLKRKQVARIT